MLGCTNPAAKNYNPAADEDDGSCVYLVGMNGACLQFEDVNIDEQVDESFTLSYDTAAKNWSFYHDYFPDYYFHTRKQLYNTKNNTIFINNRGPRGLYHNRLATKPFFIDVVFQNKETLILNGVNWITEVRAGGNRIADENTAALYNETISAITIWNNYQTTGRIPLTKGGVTILPITNSRNSEQTWSFNKFRNVALENVQFLDTIFNDYKIKTSAVGNFPWYKAQHIKGKYFIVRFEFVNTQDKQITIHDVDIDVNQSYRA